MVGQGATCFGACRNSGGAGGVSLSNLGQVIPIDPSVAYLTGCIAAGSGDYFEVHAVEIAGQDIPTNRDGLP